MNKNLTLEQKKVLLKEGTEKPGSSSLNYEKREGDYLCAGCRTKLFESKKNTKVALVGHLFMRLYLVYLKLKLTI